MEIHVEHLGNVQFEIETRGHRILCDQPLNAGGDDERHDSSGADALRRWPLARGITQLTI